ncbi:MAG: GNAT family N-acetyltransferase [Chloroflexota bacterium]|nr:GNAT family N-acetyltransferase [Chloroflexota bacterium]
MSEGEIVIRRGLPEDLREAGTILFDEAFGDKLRMAIRDREKRLVFMACVYAADHVVVALRDGELLGMIGLSSGAGHYRGGLMDIPWDPRPFRDLLGLRGSVMAVLSLRLTEHKPAIDELYIDGVAVAPEARGLGIGTKLLDEALVIARESNMRWLRLDVIDTNPRAQALYERLGYKVTKVQSFRYMERIIGFGGMVSMELAVGDAEAGERPAAGSGG